jgi:CRP/FNR family cyclic AMP-dependent transcriptional regulator
MPQRELLGPFPGGAAQGPVLAPNGFPVFKPLRQLLPTCLFRARVVPRPRQLDYEGKTWDPLYLSYTHLKWQNTGESNAGWELVQAIRSGDRSTSAFAAELFAETENGRLLVRDLRRTRSGLHKIARNRLSVATNQQLMKGESMNTPYGLEVVENCMSCKLRKDGWYCQFSSELLKAFSGSSHLTTFPGGAILFVEGQKARGAFVLCSGKVKLSTTTREGKILIMKMVEPGDIMGLSAVISGEAYAVTTETVGPCMVNYVEREGLLRLLERNGELGLRSAQAVSREHQSTYRDIHELVLSRSSSGKLARLLLSWVNSREKETGQELRIQAPATHEEMRKG